ncbi:MAG: flavin reductase family protein [Verrucomicrobiales bacterium]
MTYDLDHLDPSDRYKILASLVVPRPIAWITTLNLEGKVNAAPFSFFNVFGTNPPLVIFAPGNRDAHTPKDTALNIRQTHEFVVNLVSPELGAAMAASAAPLPHGVNELEGLDLSLTPSDLVAPPRISEAPASLECREHSMIEIGGNRLMLGIVHRVHTRDALFDENFRLQAPHNPIGRKAAPSSYCHSEPEFEL